MSFENNYSSCTRRSSENICGSSAGAQEKGKTGWMKLSLAPKLVEKSVWVPVMSFWKIFILRYVFDALLCLNWPFSPTNRMTLQITLLALHGF